MKDGGPAFIEKHTCHHHNCIAPVQKERWACKTHWFRLPKYIRDEIWKHYRPGQCDDGKPSKEWLAAARMAKNFWRENDKT